MSQQISLARLLKKNVFPTTKDKKKDQSHLDELQLKMLRIQQGIWHQKKRAVIVFEGFDAAGKGSAIRRLVESLDPRSVQVYGINAPSPAEQGRHYLYRFWKKLPLPGHIAIFDRSWYGRVLVERVNKIVLKERWKAAFDEINEFESALQNDGIDIIKCFLAISKLEQLHRFEQRLNDPYKQWKLSESDVQARGQWDEYVEAVDEMFQKTHSDTSPWHLVAANDKRYTRRKVLSVVTDQLKQDEEWMESRAQNKHIRSLREALRQLGIKKSL